MQRSDSPRDPSLVLDENASSGGALRQCHGAADEAVEQCHLPWLSILRPLEALAVFLFFLGALAYCAHLLFGNMVYGYINTLIPISIALSLIRVGFCIARRETSMVATPVFWLLVSSVLFSGIGPLLYVWGDPEALVRANAIWYLESGDLFRTNFLCLVGFVSILVGFVLALPLLLRAWPTRAVAMSLPVTIRRMRLAIWVFFVVGWAVRIFVIVPADFASERHIIPGIFRVFEYFIDVGLLLLGILASFRGRRAKYLLILLLCTEITYGLLDMNKSTAVFGLVFATMGYYLGSRQLKALVFLAGGAVLLFVLIKPVVSESRDRAYLLSNGTHLGDAKVRTQALVETLTKGANAPSHGPEVEKKLGWWIRLAYANIQAYAMHEYDSGRPSNTYSLIYYVFIPRAIWRDKPVITDVARDLNQKITGTRTSSMGVSVYADAYWNGGWPCLVLTCLFIGAALAVFTRNSVVWLRNRQYQYLPCVLLAIRIGFSIDSRFVEAYVGTFAVYAVLWFGARLLGAGDGASQDGRIPLAA